MKRPHRPLLALLAACGLAGCVGQQGGHGPEPWSTKSRSAGGSTVPRLADAPPAPFQLAVGLDSREAAIGLLREASVSGSPLLRANAIEALAVDRALVRDALASGLVDVNRGVRFVSAMTVGTLRLESLGILVEPLLRDEHPSVRAAAICALAKLGRPVDQTPLALMIQSDDPEIRGNAALVLGEIGNSSAVPLLQQSLGRGMRLVDPARARIVELQVAEALVKLGELSALDPIRAALFAPPEQAELVVLGAQIVGRIRDERSLSALLRLVEASDLDQRPPEIRLAAASALGELGRADAALLEVVERYAISDRSEIRAQAAHALGRLRLPAGAGSASRLMGDADPVVQVTAAGAVLRLGSASGGGAD